MISPKDRAILRALAVRVAELASRPGIPELGALWKAHNGLKPSRPMILVFPEGSWGELLPESSLACEGKRAREIERSLRVRIYTADRFKDDSVVEREWTVQKAVRNSGWGLEPREKPRTTERGSWGFDPVIVEPADLKKLRLPEISVDEAASARALDEARGLFGDILDVRQKGVAHLSFHLTGVYCRLRGLEQVMLDMYENPAMLHEAVGFIEEGYRGMTRQYEELGLLSLNNDGTYHSSGGNGYTEELPAEGFDPSHVRPRDMWASAESQEMAQVSPEMHEEFVMRYERRLLAPFGLLGYGCCEDLTRKLDRVMEFPRMRRVSVSPWADVDACAERLGDLAIFSWKPHPSHLVGEFDEEKVRKYIAHTVEVAAKNGCVLEMILKDTHTCENHPERFDRWTRIAREVVEGRS